MKVESVAKTLFVGTGLALSAAVAFLPLTSYAETQVNPAYPAGFLEGTAPDAAIDSRTCQETSLSSGTPNSVECKKGLQVNFNVQPSISVDAYSASSAEGGSPIVLSPNTVAEGTFSAKVIANTGYTLSLSADHGVTSMQHETDANGLIPASSSLTAGTSGWAIKDASGSYKAITDTPTEWYTSDTTTPVTDKVTEFTVGIAVSPTLPAGIYTGTVVVTASAK